MTLRCAANGGPLTQGKEEKPIKILSYSYRAFSADVTSPQGAESFTLVSIYSIKKKKDQVLPSDHID